MMDSGHERERERERKKKELVLLFFFGLVCLLKEEKRI